MCTAGRPCSGHGATYRPNFIQGCNCKAPLSCGEQSGRPGYAGSVWHRHLGSLSGCVACAAAQTRLRACYSEMLCRRSLFVRSVQREHLLHAHPLACLCMAPHADDIAGAVCAAIGLERKHPQLGLPVLRQRCNDQYVRLVADRALKVSGAHATHRSYSARGNVPCGCSGACMAILAPACLPTRDQKCHADPWQLHWPDVYKLRPTSSRAHPALPCPLTHAYPDAALQRRLRPMPSFSCMPPSRRCPKM